MLVSVMQFSTIGSTSHEGTLARENALLEQLVHKNVTRTLGRPPMIVCDQRNATHPCMLMSLGCSSHDGTIQVLSEYSSSLHSQMLLQNRRFNEVQVMEAALDIARGMNFLHSKGVAHRFVACRF